MWFHDAMMSGSGQTEKNSVRVYVFRFAPESRHRALQSACLFRARCGLLSLSLAPLASSRLLILQAYLCYAKTS
jgi:hypothetical protein